VTNTQSALTDVRQGKFIYII